MYITQIPSETLCLTWTKTAVFMWRVSTRSDKWFNHSRWSATDWVRSLLLCIRRKWCQNRRELQYSELQTLFINRWGCIASQMYPGQVVLQFNSSKANVLQFVNLLFQPVVKLLHHHQAFIASDAAPGSHPGSQKHTSYSRKTERMTKYIHQPRTFCDLSIALLHHPPWKQPCVFNSWLQS